MGQRTQLLIIEQKPDFTVTKRLYHNQWGYGRRLFNGMMSVCQSLLDGCSPYGTAHPKLCEVELKNLPSFSNYFTNGTPEWKEWKNARIENIGSIKALYEQLDNNDGGLVVSIEWTNDESSRFIPSYEWKIKAGFVLGYESGESHERVFKKFVSPERYRAVEGYRFVDDDFWNAFVAITKAAEVQWVHEENNN